ncbi:hypothetical protein [Lactococcus lactis]|uniref:hypothetical protein n=1 Tax=Lactococcus lactis TaxID=1358 RepID=UPI00223B6867|nr:hypothetical protein [Lactococcus lactis]MCT0442536.1 hypothetical protein [Lactococcus lactis subsp. lactis]
MAGKNVTVNINEVVEDKLKLAAESFAIKIFNNPEIGNKIPGALEAAVQILSNLNDNKKLTPIQNFN